MKSKIQIDVDHDNHPIIKIEYIPSEDVRDKLVKKFLESFEHTSQWAEFWFSGYVAPGGIENPVAQTAMLRPINREQLAEHSMRMDITSKDYKATITKNLLEHSQIIGEFKPKKKKK